MSEQGLPAEVEAQSVALASIGQRVGGALVDGLLTSMVVVVPLLLGVITVDDLQGQLPPGWAVVLLVFGAVYTVVPTALWGQTLGKVAIGTRVVTEADGSLPGWRRSTIRWALPGLAGRLPYIGIFVSLGVTASLVLDARRRGLHDKAAGTIVVRA
ncbi:MAG: RDD family protein [Actinomycetota bacterium]|nr:RDD family protein [Actinomycetota bacterium]